MSDGACHIEPQSARADHSLADVVSDAGERSTVQPERPASERPPTQSVLALWTWIKLAGLNFSRINGTNWAASFAYYAFFALVPILLLVLTVGTDVAARFQGEREAQAKVFDFVLANVPLGAAGQQMIAETIQGVMKSRGQIGVIALAGLLWSSLGFFQSLVSSINEAWGNHPLNWWKLPLKNLLMIGVLFSALALGVILPAMLKIVQGFLTWGGPMVTALFNLLVVLVPAVVLFYGFLLFYKFAPRRRVGVTFSMVWLPALLVTALLQVCQQLFVLYSTKFTNFNAVYGAFGGVIALMLWTYLSGVVIVFGGCLCAAQREMRASSDGPAVPLKDSLEDRAGQPGAERLL